MPDTALVAMDKNSSSQFWPVFASMAQVPFKAQFCPRHVDILLCKPASLNWRLYSKPTTVPTIHQFGDTCCILANSCFFLNPPPYYFLILSCALHSFAYCKKKQCDAYTCMYIETSTKTPVSRILAMTLSQHTFVAPSKKEGTLNSLHIEDLKPTVNLSEIHSESTKSVKG